MLRCAAVTFAYPPKVCRAAEAQGRDSGDGFDKLKVVLRNVDCKLTLRSKVACLGGNGAGKYLFVSLFHVLDSYLHFRVWPFLQSSPLVSSL